MDPIFQVHHHLSAGRVGSLLQRDCYWTDMGLLCDEYAIVSHLPQVHLHLDTGVRHVGSLSQRDCYGIAM